MRLCNPANYTPKSWFRNTELFPEYNRVQLDGSEIPRSSSIHSTPEMPFDVPHALRRAIGLVANLCLATSQAQVIGLLSTYVLASGTTETWSDILSYLQENLLETTAEPESPMIVLPDWLQALKNYQMNWKDLAHGKTKDKIEQFLGILVAFNLCEAANVSFQLGRFKLFRPTDLKSLDVFTVFDLMFETGVYFIEVGYCAWAMKEPKILFMGVSGYDIDTEFAQLKEYWKYYELGNLKDQVKISETVYFQRLNALHNNLSAAMYQAFHPSEKSIIAARRSFIGGLLCRFDQKRLGGAPKVRTFMINLFGDSSVGKSPMMDVVIQTLLASRDYSTDPCYVYTRDSRVKFWDRCRSDHLAVKLDDPTFSKDMKDNFYANDMRIIGNNQATAVDMSAVEDKAKVIPCFQVAVTSTNAKDLRAAEIAYCPWAFQRRNHFVLTVKVRPEFCAPGTKELDTTRVAAHYGEAEPPLIEDLWLITVEKPTPPTRVGYNCAYQVATYRNTTLKDVSFETAIQFLIEQYNEHMDYQEMLVDIMLRRARNMKKCGIDGCKQIQGHCPDHGGKINETDVDVANAYHGDPPVAEPATNDNSPEESLAEPEFGVYDATKWIAQRSLKGFLSKKESAERNISLMLVAQYERHFYTFEYLKLLPTWVCELPGFAPLMSCIDTWGFSKTYTRELLKLLIFNALMTLAFVRVFGKLTYVVGILFTIYRLRYYSEIALEVYQQQLLRRNRTLTAIDQRQRDAYANAAIMASTTIAGMYIIFKSRKLWKETTEVWNDIFGSFSPNASPVNKVSSSATGSKTTEQLDVTHETQDTVPTPIQPLQADPPSDSIVTADAHGSFEPEVVADILARDAAYNDWGEVVIRPVPVSPLSRTMSRDDFLERVGKHLLYAQLVAPNGDKMMVQLLIVSTGFAIVPYHYFQLHDRYEATGFRDEPQKSGGRIATRLSMSRSYRIPGSDLCLCCIDSGGAVSGLLQMFSDGDVPDCAFHMLRRTKEGVLSKISGRGTVGMGSHTLMKNFNAMRYSYLEEESQGGWCGSPIISDGKFPAIVGLHVAGKDLWYKGYSCTLTIAQIQAAMTKIKELPGTVRMGNVVAEPNMGQLQYQAVLPHVKSPLRYQRPEAQFSYHGATGKRVKPSHQVIKTPISLTVSEVFGIEDTTQPPGIHPDWKGLQKTLQAAANPGLPHEHHLMDAAARDYITAGCEVFKKDLFKHTSPLTKEQTINGIAGLKFVDPINMKSSAHPWSGPKSDYMEGAPGARQFNAEIDEMWAEAKEWLRQGKRLGLASKSCLKSEVHWKWKCRYFYVAHTVLTLLVREYYLPLIRVMQLNPFVFECAVGLNAHGPDWDALHEHVFKYGSERLIGGDYKEYDTRVPAQGIQYAFWCLHQFAKCCNYTEDDLQIMETLAGELIYPIVDFNGDLVSLSEGTHVSGNSLTVILNGIVGSLNMRCFFLKEYPNTNFRDAVSLITYGDDNAGSVKTGYELFNIKNFANYLAGIGQIYTMPDKDKELQEYLDPDEFEFLKRKSVYHEELGCRIGALSEKSMLKSLLSHNYDKKNPLSEMEVTCQAMESFVIECFNHGKEFHADYMSKVRAVAVKHDIAHHVRNLYLDYEQGVKVWKHKYRPQDADPISAECVKDGDFCMDTQLAACDDCELRLQESI